MAAFIDARHISYAYPTPGEAAKPALDDLSLQIERGEYVAIVGANGSGKSTLARHLNALLVPQEGYVRVCGHNTRDPVHHPEIRRAVGMVFQRPEDQIVGTLVAHDVAFGLENLQLPTDEIQRRVESALRGVSLWEERERPPHMLSAGQMQRLALAGILAMRPACIVFDEATAMLDPAGRSDVRETMRQLHEDGLTIVAITHRMEEALEADRVVVLDQGHVVLEEAPQHLFHDPASIRRFGLDMPPAVALADLLFKSVPALADSQLDQDSVLTATDLILAIDGAGTMAPDRTPSYDDSAARHSAPPETREHQAVIEVQGLGHTYMQDTPFARRALHDVNMRICAEPADHGPRESPTGQADCPGGSHGLIGATGSGKSTLLQHLNGLLRPQEGHVQVLSYDLGDADVDLREVRRKIGLAFQRPEAQIFEQYVGDEIAYGPRLAGLDGDELRERVRWAMDLVGLDFEGFKDRFTFALSGGEQRKVALASILALRPRVLLLDEPTAGLDPASKADLMQQLASLRQSGITLVLSSHEMEDIAALTEQATVLAEGTVVLSGSLKKVYGNGQQLRGWGLELPVVAQVAEGLRARGWSLPQGLIDAGDLCAALANMTPSPDSGTETG